MNECILSLKAKGNRTVYSFENKNYLPYFTILIKNPSDSIILSTCWMS